jgi:hypothetical protein
VLAFVCLPSFTENLSLSSVSATQQEGRGRGRAGRGAAGPQWGTPWALPGAARSLNTTAGAQATSGKKRGKAAKAAERGLARASVRAPGACAAALKRRVCAGPSPRRALVAGTKHPRQRGTTRGRVRGGQGRAIGASSLRWRRLGDANKGWGPERSRVPERGRGPRVAAPAGGSTTRSHGGHAAWPCRLRPLVRGLNPWHAWGRRLFLAARPSLRIPPALAAAPPAQRPRGRCGPLSCGAYAAPLSPRRSAFGCFQCVARRSRLTLLAGRGWRDTSRSASPPTCGLAPVAATRTRQAHQTGEAASRADMQRPVIWSTKSPWQGGCGEMARASIGR